jgi:hypothetical protein
MTTKKRTGIINGQRNHPLVPGKNETYSAKPFRK